MLPFAPGLDLKLCAALGLFFVHSLAWAQLATDAPRARGSFSLGASYQNLTYDSSAAGTLVHATGYSPTVGRLAAAGFFTSWLGAELDASFEVFRVYSRDDTGRAARLFGGRVQPALIGRLAVRRWLQLELLLGGAVGLAQSLAVAQVDGALSTRSRLWGGLLAGFALSIEPDGWVGGQLWARVTRTFGGFDPLGLAAGAQLFLGDLAFGELHGAAVVELGVDSLGLDRTGSGGEKFQQLFVRTSLGVRFKLQAPPPPPPPVAPAAEVKPDPAPRSPQGPGRIKGVVTGEKDAALEGAEVALQGGVTVKTHGDGSYALERAGPGLVTLKVSAAGYTSQEDQVQVPPEGEATASFTLLREGEKAPATIRGLVKSAAGKAVPKVTVKILELNLRVPVKADGRFVVQLPGGTYTVAIDAPGYIRQDKPLQVGDGDQAIFHCELQPANR